MKYPNNPQISIVASGHAEDQHLPHPEASLSPTQLISAPGTTSEEQPHYAALLDGFAEFERTLLSEPLNLTACQSQRLIRAAIGVDATIWRLEMGELQTRGFTVANPEWAQVSMEKMIPWFECKAQLVLTTGMPFSEVLELTVADLRLSPCETRLESIRGHRLTDECSGLIEVVFPFGQLALFPWKNPRHATSCWLRACRNAGLLRRHPTKASRRS